MAKAGKKARKTSTARTVKRTAKKTARAPSRGAASAAVGGTSGPAANAEVKAATAAGGPPVRVRMYRHGLGDCFLVGLPGREGSFNVMIDCGVIGAKTFSETDVVTDILKETRDEIDLLVVTHEHEDHVSGFRVAQPLMQGKVKRVWMGWTEDPEDALATRLQAERNARKKTLHMLMDKLASENRPLANGVAGILGFFAVDAASDVNNNRTRQGLDAARNFVPRKDLRYCRPKDAPVSFPEAPDFRFYVLGPPVDEAAIRRTDVKSERYPRLALSGQLNMDAFAAAAAELLDVAAEPGATNPDRYCPFDAVHRLPIPAVESGALGLDGGGPARSRSGASALDRYFDLRYFGNAPVYDGQGADQKWRRIDGDWLMAASDFALQLDRFTNNTSLALAIEHIPSGRVLLFAADAQVGNWLSWQDLSWTVGDNTVRGPDLLKRTVFYKVGHHGSENATLSTKGLEEMVSKDLVAFIPVFETTAKARNWNFMPLPRIMDELTKRTGGRTVRADQPFTQMSGFNLVNGPGDLYYEYLLPP